jgi:hypothetical protein
VRVPLDLTFLGVGAIHPELAVNAAASQRTYPNSYRQVGLVFTGMQQLTIAPTSSLDQHTTKSGGRSEIEVVATRSPVDRFSRYLARQDGAR